MTKTETTTARGAQGQGTTNGAGALDIRDSRTGKSYSVPILEPGTEGDTAIRAMDLRQVKTSADEFGLMTYDPAFMNTASCKSAITYIDGDKGILRYRGYPIEQLAENASFLEVAWLLRRGELPTQEEYDGWVHDITFHTYVHENVRKRFMDGFHHDAHPMGILVGTVGALSTFYPEAKNISDPEVRMRQVVRLIAKMPTLAAFAHRFSVGLPFVFPDNSLDFPSNFLSMMWKIAEPRYEADPDLARDTRHAVLGRARREGTVLAVAHPARAFLPATPDGAA